MVNKLSIPLILLTASALYASPLRTYRDALHSTEKMQTAALARAAKIRTMLSTAKDGAEFAAVRDPKGPFLDFPAGSDAGKKSSNMGFLKDKLMGAAEDLYRSERRDKPPTFDPSSYVVEIDEKVVASRNKFCETSVAQNFPQWIESFASMIALNEKTSGARAGSRDPADRDRIRRIQEHLDKQGPQYEWNKKSWGILDLLGEVEAAQFVDGKVQRITFATKQRDASVRRIPLTLSALITFRTGRDPYFLSILDCLARYLDERVENKRPGPETPAALNIVRQELASGRAVAKDQHRGLASLNLKQRDTLLALFLELRGNDLPVEQEMMDAGPSSIVDYIRKRDAELSQDSKEHRSMLDDYDFYRSLHGQLYELENYLEESRGANAQANMMVREVKEWF